MPQENLLPIEDLLNHPQVRRVTESVSDEARRRRDYRPRTCRVFSAPFTSLRENTQYRFDLDPSAVSQLDRIIGNRVQEITAGE